MRSKTLLIIVQVILLNFETTVRAPASGIDERAQLKHTDDNLWKHTEQAPFSAFLKQSITRLEFLHLTDFYNSAFNL